MFSYIALFYNAERENIDTSTCIYSEVILITSPPIGGG